MKKQEYDREVDQLESKARMTVASIVGMLYDVPRERLAAIQSHLDRALEEAKAAKRTATEKVRHQTA